MWNRSPHHPLRLPLLLLLGLGMVASAAAQQPGTGLTRFEALVDKTQLGVGEPFIFTLVIEYTSNQMSAPPTDPDFGKVRITGGPSQSSQVVSTNFSSAKAIFTKQWELMAPAEGRYIIGVSTLQFSNQSHETKAVTIQATQDASASALPDDLKNEPVLFAKSKETRVNQMLEGRLFLRPAISNKEPYVGEAVIIKYDVLNDRVRVDFGGSNMVLPQVQGALKEEIFQANSIDNKTVTYNGRQFALAPLYYYAVIPSKPGELSIDGMTIDARLPTSTSRDPLDDFFSGPMFARGLPVTLPSPPVILKVKPLPDGAPPEFSGTVGDFQMEMPPPATALTEDDMITLELVLSGKGAIELADAPVFPASDDFDVVGQSAKAEKEVTPDTFGGKKIFEIVLRPKHAGRLNLPPLKYGIFNPREGQYKTLETKPVSFQVAPGNNKGTSAPEGENAPKSRQMTTRDLNYLLPVANLRTLRPGLIFQDPLFWLAQLAAAGLLIFCWRRDRRRGRMNAGELRRSKAWPTFNKRIREIRRRIDKGENVEETAGALEHAARALIADRFGQSPEGLTRRDIAELLQTGSMSTDRINRLLDILELCSTVRYAPAGMINGNLTQWTDEVTQLLKEGVRE